MRGVAVALRLCGFIPLAGCAAVQNTPTTDAQCRGGRVRAAFIALELDEVTDTQGPDVEKAVSAVPGVMRAAMNVRTEVLSVIADAHADVTAERLVALLRTAGYTAREADEQKHERALEAMRAGGAIVLASDHAAPSDAAGDPDKGARMGNLTIIDDTLNPLRDRFNADKDKHRFVAILSPT
jgi:hypothetical protein